MIYINKLNSKIIKKEKKFVICDFDRTITKSGSPTTWNIFNESKLVNPLLGQASQKLFDYYRKIEENSKISIKVKRNHMREWAIREVNLFRKYGIDKNSFYEIIDKENTIVFRDDFADFVTKLDELGIKLYIVSGGIYDVIRYTLEKSHLLLNNVEIISNHLNFDKGVITGLNGDIIHSCNKDIITLPIENDESGLLFGDLPGDKLIGYNYDTIDIGFCTKDIDYYKSIFDIVLTGESSFSNVANVLIKSYKK